MSRCAVFRSERMYRTCKGLRVPGILVPGRQWTTPPRVPGEAGFRQRCNSVEQYKYCFSGVSPLCIPTDSQPTVGIGDLGGLRPKEMPEAILRLPCQTVPTVLC